MSRAIGYVRVSTEEQARGGVSLAAQRAKLVAWAEFAEAKLVDVVEDPGYSGSNMARPGLDEVLRRLRAGEADCLVVYAIDRLSRSTIDFLATVDDLAKRGISFVSVREHLDSTTPHGKFTTTILAAMAEMERDLIAVRTREGMERCRVERRVYSRTPYGFDRREGRLVPNEAEASVVAEIGTLRRGGMSWRGIAEILNRRGVRAKRGGPWKHTSVQSVHRTAGRFEGVFDVA